MNLVFLLLILIYLIYGIYYVNVQLSLQLQMLKVSGRPVLIFVFC